MPGDTPAVCATVEAVRTDLSRRAEMGLAKYGQTVADNPLAHRQWLQHAYEEVLDTAVYLKRAISQPAREVDASAASERHQGWMEGQRAALAAAMPHLDAITSLIATLTAERDAALTALRAREAEVRFAAGYISATAAFSGQHPEEVLRWIQKESAALATPATEDAP